MTARTMGFGDVLAALRQGRAARRRAWESGLSIELLGERIVWVARAERGRHDSEWPATHASLLANDWQLLPATRRRDGEALAEQPAK